MNELSPKTFRLILLICLLVQPFLPAPAAAAETKSALNADASMQAAFTALKKKNYPRALSELEPALEQRGNDPVALNLKG
ncbi:MAG: hypothetical protein WCO97_08680, partial [bacterium]